MVPFLKFVNLGRTIRKHLDGIPAIFESRSRINGPSEGINSAIQCPQAHASRFLTIEIMIAIFCLMMGELGNLPLSWKKSKIPCDPAAP